MPTAVRYAFALKAQLARLPKGRGPKVQVRATLLMLSKVSNPPAGFDELTVEEKLDYVGGFGTASLPRPKLFLYPIGISK